MRNKFRNTLVHRLSAGLTTFLAIVLISFVMYHQGILSGEKGLEVIALMALIAIISILRVFDWFKINSHPAIFMAGYNLVFISAQIYIFAPYHPLSFIWIVLLVRTQNYLGVFWSYFWWAMFALSSFIGIIVVSSTINDFFYIISQIGVALMIAVVLQDSDSQQNDFDKARDDEIERGRTLQHRLESLFNNLSSAIFGLNSEGVIVVYNNEALDIINQNSELHGVKIDEALTLKDDNDALYRFADIRKIEDRFESNKMFLHVGLDDKTPVQLIISKFRESYAFDDGISYVLTLRDISKEEKLDHEQSDFIAIVSHELRTPITVAEGNLSNAIMINDYHDKNQEVDHALKIAHEQVMFLSQMINNISTLSQAEEGALDIQLERIEPERVIEQVSKMFEDEVSKKEIKLKTEVIDHLTPIISSKTYIVDILKNIVENAVKYTDKGTVTIGVKRDDGDVIFYVSDTGIGVSHSDSKHVFDKFFRAEDHETQTRGGTGLGLYVSYQLAKRINATLSVDSKLGRGSTFSLTIPRVGALKRDNKKIADTELSDFIAQV